MLLKPNFLPYCHVITSQGFLGSSCAQDLDTPLPRPAPDDADGLGSAVARAAWRHPTIGFGSCVRKQSRFSKFVESWLGGLLRAGSKPLPCRGLFCFFRTRRCASMCALEVRSLDLENGVTVFRFPPLGVEISACRVGASGTALRPLSS